MTRTIWTEQKCQILRDNYAAMSPAEIARRWFPHMRPDAVAKKARTLGLHRGVNEAERRANIARGNRGMSQFLTVEDIERRAREIREQNQQAMTGLDRRREWEHAREYMPRVFRVRMG